MASTSLRFTQVVGRNVRRLRRIRGFETQKHFAEELKQHRVRISRATIAKLESDAVDDMGELTVEQVFGLAWALNVSPTDLLLPMADEPGYGPEYEAGIEWIVCTPGWRVQAHRIRSWLHGEEPIDDDADPLRFADAAPYSERLVHLARRDGTVQAAERLVDLLHRTALQPSERPANLDLTVSITHLERDLDWVTSGVRRLIEQLRDEQEGQDK